MTHNDPSWPLRHFFLRMGLGGRGMVVLDNPLGLESKNRTLKLSLQL